MKRLLVSLVPVLLSVSTVVFAQGFSFEEKIHVVQTKNSEPLENPAESCAWANNLFVQPVGGDTADLYSLQSKKTNGIVLKEGIKKVGEMIGCFDIGSPQLERGVVPTYDLGRAWGIRLEEQDYIVTGMSRLRTDPSAPQDQIFGVPGTALLVSTGTIFTRASLENWQPGDDLPSPVGSLSGNAIINLIPGFVSPIPAESILTLRIYTPVDNGDID